MSITHMGMNSVTRTWERQSTYGGKIVENLCQAVARDLMANAMINAEAAEFKVVLTVHDELLTEVNLYGVDFEAHALEWPTKALFEKIMTDLPAWAAGLPVKAEAWTGKRYLK